MLFLNLKVFLQFLSYICWHTQLTQSAHNPRVVSVFNICYEAIPIFSLILANYFIFHSSTYCHCDYYLLILSLQYYAHLFQSYWDTLFHSCHPLLILTVWFTIFSIRDSLMFTKKKNVAAYMKKSILSKGVTLLRKTNMRWRRYLWEQNANLNSAVIVYALFPFLYYCDCVKK